MNNGQLTFDFADDVSLSAARQWVRENRADGCSCPACGQFAKEYKRKIHATLARDLIKVFRSVAAPFEWWHLPTEAGYGGDLAKARLWGLIEEERSRRPDGGRAGYWRFTAEGAEFVLGMRRVPKYAVIFDSECLRLEGESVSIVDALGDPFHYEELMSA